MYYKLFMMAVSLLIAGAGPLKAQISDWPSPEVEQMYRQAKDYLSRGGIQQAITLYRQAIQLAPDVTILHRDLAQALHLSGSNSEAYDIVEPLINSRTADEQTYQIAGAALSAKGERKKAKNIIEKGIINYPHSGLLYYELGKNYEAAGDREYAMDAWLQGIENDPGYHLNYYEAAKLYGEAGKPVWMILYGEIFVNLERHTHRSMEIRKLILAGYEGIFRGTQTLAVPKYGSRSSFSGPAEDFESAVYQIFMQLSPVMSDGVTIENLIMLRTRFVMDWQAAYQARYPYTLFTYHDKLLRSGHFDAYNQWLLGNTENAGQYASWTAFHPNAIPAYENWALQNPFYPTAGDFYNNKKELGKLFRKKR